MVTANPAEGLRLFQDPEDNLAWIMKDGQLYKTGNGTEWNEAMGRAIALNFAEDGDRLPGQCRALRAAAKLLNEEHENSSTWMGVSH